MSASSGGDERAPSGASVQEGIPSPPFNARPLAAAIELSENLCLFEGSLSNLSGRIVWTAEHWFDLSRGPARAGELSYAWWRAPPLLAARVSDSPSSSSSSRNLWAKNEMEAHRSA